MKFSPDGKQILFFLNNGEGEAAWLMPYPANPAMPPRRVLQDLPTFLGTPQFSWLPDNRRIVVSTGTTEEPAKLFVADTVSGTFAVISSGTAPQRSPSVSSDGTRLAFLEQSIDFDIVSLDLATAQATPLLATQRMEGMAAWAAREPALAYVTDRNGAWEIWLRKPGQPDRPLVTPHDFPPNTTQWFMSPVLSPDATRVIYARNEPTKGVRLWMSAVAGGPPVRLVKGPEQSEYAGGWSLDGRWFAYWAGQDDSTSLNKVKTTGEATAEVVKANIDRRRERWVPIWSPAGDWILHVDDGAKLISPDGKTTRALRTGVASAYAFSSDGQTVYGIRTAGPGRAELFSMRVDVLANMSDMTYASRR